MVKATGADHHVQTRLQTLGNVRHDGVGMREVNRDVSAGCLGDCRRFSFAYPRDEVEVSGGIKSATSLLAHPARRAEHRHAQHRHHATAAEKSRPSSNGPMTARLGVESSTAAATSLTSS